MSNKNIKELKSYSTEKKEKNIEELLKEQDEIERIIKPQYTPKISGNLTALISGGFDDNKQMEIFESDKGVTYFGASYKYRDKNTKLSAIYKQNDPIYTLTEETKKKYKQLVDDKVILSKDINTFTKKIFHLFHVYAFLQWHEKGYTKENINNILAKDLQVTIPKADIQKLFNVSQPYIAKNLTTAIYSLRNIEILEFTTKRRDKGVVVTGGNDIKQLFKSFDTTQRKNVMLEFSLEYAKYLFDYGFIQYPIKIFSCENSTAFDILEYIYRYYFLSENHKNIFTITRKKLLENVKSISSFKDVEERFNRKYKEKIYNPLNNAILYINDNFEDLLEIETLYTQEEMQEQEQGKQEEDSNVDKDAWASRKLKIILKDAPNYGTKQEKNRKKAQRKQ